MSDTPEKKLQLINDGRFSAIVSQHVGSLIAERKNQKIKELSQNFRAGKIDQATLVSGVAGIVALEDLEIEITRKILKGERAAHDLNKEQT